MRLLAQAPHRSAPPPPPPSRQTSQCCVWWVCHSPTERKGHKTQCCMLHSNFLQPPPSNRNIVGRWEAAGGAAPHSSVVSVCNTAHTAQWRTKCERTLILRWLWCVLLPSARNPSARTTPHRRPYSATRLLVSPVPRPLTCCAYIRRNPT